ncbi:glycoside hydrolase family 16 protein [Streptomyces sp. MB09-01]|uniref:glycoside hydrolase family 16 protein n=1 Tax=Streptomyces sp. MB09-01 TaxID=3028666 RepID=UPI0029A0E317|nr:glycoside hydrolase family 16 protein [Streptomyces sp. MB09-01]MDX3533770.1 glycoside hydrolase family 16 protein [Streptomyces sp. MB09-01]
MSQPRRTSRRHAWAVLTLPALLCALTACSGAPASGKSADAPARSAPPTPSGPPGTLFDNFHYSGPEDPSLTANGWEVRDGAGSPGIKDTWSSAGAGFLSDATAQGGRVLQLQASTDGTKQGTKQVEVQSTGTDLFTGTYAARVHFGNKPTSGRNGDHVVQTFFPISPSDSSANYSELDHEYLPNGGWGSVGPRLDNVSWYKADPPDRVNHTFKQRLEGWHIMMITAVDGKVTYSLDGKELFTSSGKYVPREKMDIHFSNWFIDLPFTGGPRTWDMKVNWFYYKADEAVSQAEVQKAVDGFYSAGTNYINTVPKS